MGGTRRLRQSDPARGSLDGGIPSIDAALLTGSRVERAAAAARIRTACLSTGFFCVENMLCRSESYPNVLSLMQDFFALSDDDPIKRAIDVSGKDNTNGWMPMYQEPAYQPGTIAHVESFDCGRPAKSDADRPNRWPAIDGFQDEVRRLWDELSGAGWTVLRALSQALELEHDYLVERCDSQDLSTMRLLHYPPVDPLVADDANVGIAAHTDFECMTFIMQTAPGLELMDTHGRWYDAPAGSDTTVVLLGDMLERWTNGVLKATGHRVRNREFERYSVVLFFAVNDEVSVSPIEPFVSARRPARFDAIGQRAHTRAELERAELLREEFAARSDG